MTKSLTLEVKTLLEKKSTIKEIRERFDDDVERFSNLVLKLACKGVVK